MMPQPSYRGTAPRTLLAQDRAEAAAALLGHLGDEEQVAELLDFAELHGDGQIELARVTYDGESWTLDLFGQRREAAA